MRCDCNHGGNLIILLLRFDGIFRDYLGFSSKPERKINKNKTEIIEKEEAVSPVMVHKTSDNNVYSCDYSSIRTNNTQTVNR